ncbi:hypothetical protein FGB62_87g071 [Gracilaria domingensis]|nr:hypothetical protein FGB62_87g071 [Gracilaria domingensis]
MDINYGLGDVIRGLIHCYLCAVVSKRLFLLNLTDPFPLATVLDNPPGYNFTYNPVIFGPRGGESINQPVRFTRPVYFDELDLVLSNTTMLVDQTQNVLDWDLFLEIPRLYPELDLSVKLASVSDFKPSREEVVPFILKALFHPSAEYRKLMSVPVDYHNLWSPKRFFRTDDDALRRISTNRRYVSIHARIGYGLHEKTPRFNLESRNITFKDVACCLAQMATEIANDRRLPIPHQFFISTDTDDFRTILKREILRIDPTARVFHTRWHSVHLKGVGGIFTPSKLRNYMNTYMDVYLLSRGDSMLFIRSGFAHVALWMGAMTRFVGIQLDYCLRVMNGSASLRESMHDAVVDRAGFYTNRYHSILNREKNA